MVLPSGRGLGVYSAPVMPKPTEPQVPHRTLARIPVHLLGRVYDVVDLDAVKDVLAVVGLYEDSDRDCNNALIDHETGLDPATVDQVLEYLWRTERIEGIMTLGGRNPSLDSIRRVLPNRERLWGDDGCYQPHP